MEKLEVLWVDLRANHNKKSYCRFLKEDWRVTCITSTDHLDLRNDPPSLLCFEFDYPDIPGLSTLRQIKRRLPSLPIIMLTEQHSESLAVWALRARVWDYFVKPLSGTELKNSAGIILAQNNYGKEEPASLKRPPNPLPVEVRFRPYHQKLTYPALTYVENHSHEKIYEKNVAELCGLKPSAFSRSFKKENGITFRDYLVRFRIKNACRLLKNPNASITDICFTAGFHDPSYFTRTFKRVIGMSPSAYRAQYNKEPDSF